MGLWQIERGFYSFFAKFLAYWVIFQIEVHAKGAVTL